MANILIDGKKVFAMNGETLIKVLRQEGVFVDAPCGGAGHCGKCRVIVKGDVGAPCDTELSLLSRAEIGAGVRLACLCKALGDCEVTLKDSAEISALTNFNDVKLEALNDYKFGEIGMAVDIGTTTVAAYFYDLKSAKLLSVQSGMNLQREFGADVISRISKSNDDINNLKKMSDTIVGQINDFIKKSGLSVSHAVIAGNTTMLHLLTMLNPSSLARSPFKAESLFGTEYTGYQLGLNVMGSVYLTPCISAYVGGDITAGMIVCSLDEKSGNIFYIDIGTNGEMALLSDGIIYCCATAAGPAFEGANISCGTGSISGAINRVWLDGGDISFTTIDNKPSSGICGSGLIDLVAAMLECGAIDDTGRLLDDDELPDTIKYRRDEDGFIIDKSQNIFITQKDIREVQLAKSAIAAGIDCLFHYASISPDELDSVVIAGGFGAHINAQNAIKIGLLPKQFKNKIELIGNGSGLGASGALLSVPVRLRLDNIASKCKYIELSGDKYFSDRYIEQMMFE